MKFPLLSFQFLLLLIVCTEIQVQGQFIYGTTQSGGTNGTGTIFRFKSDGTGFTTEYNFAPADNPGARPWYTALLEVNGKLYGTTSEGGLYGAGVLFEFDLTSGSYRVVKNFEFLQTGKFPRGNLASMNGKLYGTTAEGGSNRSGTVFVYDFASDQLSTFYSFPASANATGGLSDGGNGKIYCVRTGEGHNDWGSLLEIDPIAGTVTQKGSFAATTTGVIGGNETLTGASNGKLYGNTEISTVFPDTGIIFEFDPVNGTLSGKVAFMDVQLARPPGNLYKASNGLFYGVASGYANGVVSSQIFEYDPLTNAINKRASFGQQYSGGIVGAQAPNGKIYIVTRDSNPNSIYEFDPVSYAIIKKLDIDESVFGAYPTRAVMLASNGKLYGTTSYGGTGSVGTIFEYDPSSNSLTKKVDLNVTSNGGFPTNNLSIGPNEKLYGSAAGGTTGDGLLYEFDPVSKVYSVKIQFDDRANKGTAPLAPLTLLPNGKFIGMSPVVKAPYVDIALDDGIVFEFDPTSGSFTKKASIAPSFVSDAVNKLILAGNGKLYTGSGSGVGGYGYILEYDPATSLLSHKYQIANYAYPSGSMTLTPNGKFLGKTSGSELFEFDPINGTFTQKTFLVGDPSSFIIAPIGALLKATDGKYYGLDKGTIFSDGQTTTGFAGGVYEYNYNTNTLLVKATFNATQGYGSEAAFIEGDNGKLYALMPEGGAFGYGSLVQYDPATDVISVKQDFAGANGARPAGESMVMLYVGPTITGFSPTSGTANNLITITGVNFSPNLAENVVKFNGVTATLMGATTTSITAVIPVGATTGPISLTVNGLQGNSANDFVFPLVITSVNPPSGPIGTTVTISGNNFSSTPANNTIRFHGTTAVVAASTNTSITTKVPVGATTGSLTISVNGITATAPNPFTVMVPPTIASFLPSSGPVGTSVTITGTNFDPTPSNNSVKFNGVAATVTSATSTSIVATVPANASTGPVTVSVGSLPAATAPNLFTVMVPPTIASFLPSSGPVGTSVTITGTNFDPTPSNNSVKFNGVAATVTSATSTSIVASVPANASTGPVTVSVGSLPAATSTSNFAVTVVTGDLHVDSTNGFLIYPNPAREEIIIVLAAFEKSGDVELFVHDLGGTQIEKLSVKGTGNIVLDIRSYARGNYIIRATQGTKKFVSRFMKN